MSYRGRVLEFLAWLGSTGVVAAITTYFRTRSLTARITESDEARKVDHTRLLLLIRDMARARSPDERQRIAEEASSILAEANLTGGLKGSIISTASLGPKPKEKV